MEESFDVIVFGATGFTGQLAAKRLATEPGLKLAIAGRNRAKLESIAKDCVHTPAIIIADSDDRESIIAMVRQGRVIANYAGPFALYGEAVVAACAEYGRAYCDITGETPFIRDMIDRYEAKAKASGACLIPMAGFDSVPADILAFIAMEEGERHSWQFNSLTHYYQVGGGFNGGTLATVLTIAEQNKSRLVANTNILIPYKKWQKGPRAVLTPTYEPLLKRWSAPFFMNFINASVVRRSLFLQSPDKPQLGNIDYTERLLLSGGRIGRLKAFAVTGTLGVVGALTTNRLGRQLLRKIGPSPGQGPSEKSRLAGFYRGTLIAREDGQARVIIKMKVKGDPGNQFTALSSAAVALLLAQGKARSTGFSTPSMALGNDLIQALEVRGVVFSTDYV